MQRTSIRFFRLMLTLFASQVGASVVLWTADEAYLFGWPALLYPLGVAIGLLFLGMGVGRKFTEFQISAVSELFTAVYGSESLKKVASLLLTVSFFMLLVAQVSASHKFLLSLGWTNTPLFVMLWALFMVYTAQGGLRSIVSGDLVQVAFLSAMFLFCFGLFLTSEPSISLLSWPLWDEGANFSSKLWGWLLMPPLFMLIDQDLRQHYFSSASPQVVSKAALWAGIGTMAVCIIPAFVGSVAKTIGLEVPQGGSILITAIATTTNSYITALVGSVILAAIISYAISLVHAINANLFSCCKNRTKRGELKIQGITCLISVGAIFFSFYFDNVVDLLIQSYELSVSTLFVPIAFALYKKEGNPLTAWLAIIAGSGGFFFFSLYPISFPTELLSLLISLSGHFIGNLLVYYGRSKWGKNFTSVYMQK